jgi:hypothetical protein
LVSYAAAEAAEAEAAAEAAEAGEAESAEARHLQALRPHAKGGTLRRALVVRFLQEVERELMFLTLQPGAFGVTRRLAS